MAIDRTHTRHQIATSNSLRGRQGSACSLVPCSIFSVQCPWP